MRGDSTFSAGETLSSFCELDSYLAGIETGWSPACDPQVPEPDQWGVLKVSAVTSGRFDPKEAKRLPSGMGPRPDLEVRAGDVLVARANGARSLVGVACHVTSTRSKLMLSDKILRLVPDRYSSEPGFLALLFQSDMVKRQIGNLLNGGSGQNNISQVNVRELVVPKVSLPVQRRIMAAHAAAERNIQNLMRLTEKRDRALSAFIANRARIVAQSLGQLGLVAESIVPGITLGAHRMAEKNAVPYLRVANVRKGSIDLSDVAHLEELTSDRPRYELQCGDLLVVEGHANPEEIGRAAVVSDAEQGLLYQNHLFRVRLADAIPAFAMLWLNSDPVRTYWKSRCATSSGLFTINRQVLSEVPFPMVGTREQESIVKAWRAGSDELESARRRIAKLQAIQQGIVDRLLSQPAGYLPSKS